jgi:hypothetical protein
MLTQKKPTRMLAVPVTASAALVLAACGGGSSVSPVAQAPAALAAPAGADANPAPAAGPVTGSSRTPTVARSAPSAVRKATSTARTAKAVTPVAASKTATVIQRASPAGSAKGISTIAGENGATLHTMDTSSAAAENNRIAEQKQGVTDVGVTKNQIHMGTVSMHGMALGNVLIGPVVRGIQAEFSSENDRGGILGRRLTLTDCDDGPGEVSRTKACIRKLASVDKVFALLDITSWGAASAHDDLKLYHLPSVGQWAYSQTEWQDPYMFPTHMSMIHEAMAGAHWAANV